ncbi:replication initiator protein A [Leuconostoc mesenteroides]|uniref:replication initiator protein A n=1 Tax=Leuconostoc mesenteroides TaxID=1245 RepID=UPI000E09B3C6|nr:replication initiator protein A [Leuconostoc mesenteroides]MCM6835621.1 replication initiator protein A [Leuconostoc mesenteroides]RDG16253.1 Replication initiator protein A [Leuconostoc mesenteroides subsp. mesenteroides]
MERTKLNQVVTSERFIMFSKALIEDDYYKKMKPESKLTYSLLRNRFNLSISNEWIDSKGDVYLYYPNEKLAEDLNVGKDKVIRIKKELHEFGLLEEERQGFNNPNRIYVGNLEVRKVTENNLDISDTKVVAKCDFRKSQNANTRNRKTRLQEVANYDTNNTDLSKTEFSNTETDSLDEDETNNIKSSNDSQQTLVVIGNTIQNNPALRVVVQTLIPDLLLNEPEQAQVVVTALDQGYKFLTSELEKNNSVLTLQKQLQGDDSIKLFLLKIGGKQLEYMRDHLVGINQYGNYFAKGLENRLKIAVTTNQSVSRF